MRALWVEDGHLRYRNDVPVPRVKQEEVLIRVSLAGICATDLAVLEGYGSFKGIPGHEFVGEVLESKKNPALKGKPVVGEINLPCGGCDMCAKGIPAHCRKRRVLGIRGSDGVFAEYLVLPETNIHTVPHGVSREAAVFTEPLAAALRIFQQIRIRPTDTVLLMGGGRLGQLIAQVLLQKGCRCAVVSRYAGQSEILARRGIEVLDEKAVPFRSMDIVIEATGSKGGFHSAVNAVRPGGTLIVKSSLREEIPVDLAAVVVNEITLVGSRCGPFSPALDLLATGAVDTGPLIGGIYPLEQGIQAYEAASRPGALKILIRP